MATKLLATLDSLLLSDPGRKMERKKAGRERLSQAAFP